MTVQDVPRRCPLCGHANLVTVPVVLPGGDPSVFLSCRVCETNHWVLSDGTLRTRDEVFPSLQRD